MLTMASIGALLLIQLVLFLLQLCGMMVEAFWHSSGRSRVRHEPQCVYNGRHYESGQIVVKIPEACGDLVCGRGAKVVLQTREQCSCHLPANPEVPHQAGSQQQVRMGLSYLRLWASHCGYNRKVKNIGDTAASFSSNCLYISCQRSRGKAVLQTFLMPNCRCEGSQLPTEGTTTEPASSPSSLTPTEGSTTEPASSPSSHTPTEESTTEPASSSTSHTPTEGSTTEPASSSSSHTPTEGSTTEPASSSSSLTPTEESTMEPASLPSSHAPHHPPGSHVSWRLRSIKSRLFRALQRAHRTNHHANKAHIKPRWRPAPDSRNPLNTSLAKTPVLQSHIPFKFSHPKPSPSQSKKEFDPNLPNTVMFESVDPKSLSSGNPLFFRIPSWLKHHLPHTAIVDLKGVATCQLPNTPKSQPEASHPSEETTSPHLLTTSPHPSATSPHPLSTSPHPSTTSLHPLTASPHPLSTSHPLTASPHTLSTSPHPSITSPHPSEPNTHRTTDSPAFHGALSAGVQPPDPDALQHKASAASRPTALQGKESSTIQPTEPTTPQPTEPTTPQPIEPTNPKPTKPTTPEPTEPPIPHLKEPFTYEPQCNYSAFDPFHSMTLEPNTDCIISKSGITSEEKEEILNKHNTLRAKVARGEENRGKPGPQPHASNMCVLRWNEELASVAQAWANQCIFDHDGRLERRICSRDYEVGQNLYYQWGNDPAPNWSQAIQNWYDEVAHLPKSFVKKFRLKNHGVDIGHYGQMAWASTQEVGCGAVYYLPFMGGTTRVYVCNYGPQGNMLGMPMYQQGSPASACPHGKPSQVYPHLCG